MFLMFIYSIFIILQHYGLVSNGSNTNVYDYIREIAVNIYISMILVTIYLQRNNISNTQSHAAMTRMYKRPVYDRN